jgi:hypothetical protein
MPKPNAESNNRQSWLVVSAGSKTIFNKSYLH